MRVSPEAGREGEGRLSGVSDEVACREKHKKEASGQHPAIAV